MKVTIGDSEIGEGYPAYIIAEVGSNHNGDIVQAKRLIDVAASSGADAVKFQIFKADQLYSHFTPEFSYLKGQDTYQLMERLETPRQWIRELASHCREKEIDFLATPFDFDAVNLLEPHVPAYKISSFEIGDHELIRHAALKQKPVILSTGMASLGEIEDAIHTIQSAGNEDIILLHCTSLYPAPVHQVNLRAIRTLAHAFFRPVGFSDHTTGIHVPLAAIGIGACVLEKHITLSRKMTGPDHAFAIEPGELAEMIRNIRDVESAMGTGIKQRCQSESEEMYLKARRSIHAGVDIPRGTAITRDMLVVKRPGYGIAPKDISLVVGRKARLDIHRDQWIVWDMI